MVVAHLAGKAGHPITFRAFIRYGGLIAVLSLVIASVYMYLRYLM